MTYTSNIPETKNSKPINSQIYELDKKIKQKNEKPNY